MDDMSVIAYLNRNFMTTKKPLDVLIAEMQDYLSNYIIAESNEILLYSNNAAFSGDEVFIPHTFAMNTSGIIKIAVDASGYSTTTGYIYIYKNNVLSNTITVVGSTQTTYISSTLAVADGDVITLKISGYGTHNITIYANTLDILGAYRLAATENLIELI